MINNALYKSCLFLTGGAVEKQAGTTDLSKLGGLFARMPVTFACFLVTAVSISGVPLSNGFFSKELVYDGALERGLAYYLAAVVGSFFTAASFLKLGHAAFLGKPNADYSRVREAPLSMLAPMITIAALCILFGVYNALPLNHLIQPILGEHRLEGHHFAGWPSNPILVLLTVIVLAGAFLNHLWGVQRGGSGLGAVNHIHDAPILHPIYEKAEQRYFDPYDIGLKVVAFIARLAWGADRGIDFIYDTVTVKLTYAITGGIRRLHTGSLFTYLTWSLAGIGLIIALMLGGL